MDDLISLSEAATLVGKNLRTIQRRIKAGQLTRHDIEGKSFVSRGEVENKFRIKNQPLKKLAGEPPKKSAEISKNELDYAEKWIEEIQKHAETREELGIWKGRAEAYQSFAARLLGNGHIENIAKEAVASENKKPIDPSTSLGASKSAKIYTYLIYGMIGIFFVIMTILVLIMLKVI